MSFTHNKTAEFNDIRLSPFQLCRSFLFNFLINAFSQKKSQNHPLKKIPNHKRLTGQLMLNKSFKLHHHFDFFPQEEVLQKIKFINYQNVKSEESEQRRKESTLNPFMIIKIWLIKAYTQYIFFSVSIKMLCDAIHLFFNVYILNRNADWLHQYTTFTIPTFSLLCSYKIAAINFIITIVLHFTIHHIGTNIYEWLLYQSKGASLRKQTNKKL